MITRSRLTFAGSFGRGAIRPSSQAGHQVSLEARAEVRPASAIAKGERGFRVGARIEEPE
jgi:hypothetical protein